MKKLLLLFVSLFAFTALHAQWVDDPATNTFIVNTSDDAGEVYLSTDPVSGYTYVQWSQFESNGWVPKAQCLDFEGRPQWGADGLQPAAHYTLASWSQGMAMVATTDNAMVSCFSTEAGHSVAVKINADGSFAWGQDGLTLFNGAGGSRTELLAGDDGGVWAMATDLTNTYLCYIDANGTKHPTITISDDNGKICTFGLMVPAPDGNVFVVYEKEQWAYTYYYQKDVRVVGYSKDGTQLSEDIQLMEPQTMGGSYIHYVVPDGLGGGYAYIWHAGSGAFNTYVFHFDANGVSTIHNPNGIPVHSDDPDNYYIGAYATVDPVSHDLIIAYEQTDDATQNQSRIYVNRISTSGERLWDEGLLVADYVGSTYTDILVDAFENGGGFSIIYAQGNGYNNVVNAIGMDDYGDEIWNTTMSSTYYPRAICENSTGFFQGQNIVAWVNSNNGGIYGQNIGIYGEMGAITPPTPPDPCYPPTNFTGEYVYSDIMYGIEVSWDAPESTPLHYNLYYDGLKEVIEIDPEYTSYFQEMGPGNYTFRLTAVYEDCESEYASTPSGDDFLQIEVTAVGEFSDETLVTVMKVYTLSGQLLRNAKPEELSSGVYIFQGLTRDGRLVTKKYTVLE